MEARVKNEPSSRVKNGLETTKEAVREVGKERAAVVETCVDKGYN